MKIKNEEIKLDDRIKQEEKKELPKFDINNPPKPKTIIKPINKGIKFYVFSVLTFIISLGILIGMIIFKVRLFLIIIYFIFAFPLFMLSNMVFWIKIYLDKGKIKSMIIKRVAKQFLIANFFLDNKRVHKEAFLIKGGCFNWGNEVYTVDREAIFFDENSYPNSYYRKGIPNPLKFNFVKYVNKFIDNLQKGTPEKSKDWEDETIDISYSSKTLGLLKKDKIFQELHKQDKDMDIGQIVIMVLLVIIVIVVLIMAFKGG